MGMPKPKPDNIIRHELVLGRSERDLLDTLTTAYTANRILTPLTQLLSSTAGLLLVAGLILSYLEQYLPENWQEMYTEQITDWFDTQNIVAGTAGFGLGGIFGGPVGAALGALTGTATAEIAEEAQEAGVPFLFSYGTIGQAVGLARLAKQTIDELS